MSLIQSAHNFVQQKFPSLDLTSLTDVNIIDALDQIYPGGWSKFRTDYEAIIPTEEAIQAPFGDITVPSVRRRASGNFVSTGDRRTEKNNLVQLRAEAERELERPIRVGLFDEIVSISITDTEIKVSLNVSEVKEMSRRLRTTKTGMRLVSYKQNTDNHNWSRPDILTIWDDDCDVPDLILYGQINTPERVADKREQADTCYRPGTSRTPMDKFGAAVSQ